MLEQRGFRGTGNAGLGHHQAGRRRYDQGRDLRYQAIADRQAGIKVGRFGERKILLDDTDDHAGDDVDEGNQDAGDGGAADKLGGAVHGPEEGAFVFQVPAPGPGFILVDEAGRQVGVDGHLLAGHGVQGEPGRNLGDTAGTLGDDDEVDEHQDGENDDTDDKVVAHDEAAEGLDDLSGGVGTFVAVGEDQPRRG